MLLRQIKYFVTVVDTGSFTEAAEECFISQSAISQQILSLEKELGVQLLVRSTRRFTLTEPGKYLYSHGKKLLGETEKLKNGTIAAAAGQEGSLKVCYLNSFADDRLYKAVSMFKQQNAGVRLNVSGGTHEEIAALLRDGKTDIAFNLQRHVVSEEYEMLPVVSLPCFIEVSSVYGGFEGGCAELKDLEQIPCILVADEIQRETEKDFYTQVLGFEGSFVFARSVEEARIMAAAGNGFLFGGSAAPDTKPSEGIRILALYQGGKQAQIKYYLFWKKANTNNYIKDFANVILEAFRPQKNTGN